MRKIPNSYLATDTLPDGRIVYIRAIRPSDRKTLLEEFHKLSSASVRDRFFSLKQDLSPEELTYFTEVDFSRHVALVAELDIGQRRRPVGVGRMVSKDDQPQHSEMAITVVDEFHGKGIGKVLLDQLIHCARKLEVHYLDASVLEANTRMSSLLRHTGLPVEAGFEDGVRTYSLAL